MTFFVGDIDATCMEGTAHEYIGKMRTETTIIDNLLTDHSYWAEFPAYTDRFMTKLLEQLAL